MPVIGYLNGASAAQFPHLLAAFRKDLSETGHAEGRNVTIEYRYADGQYDRLPALAADLVDRRVAAIVATAGTPTIRAAKAATSTIPIVFVIGGDPVTFGLVTSLNRPGGNITGVTLIAAETVAKRLGLLLELVPTASDIGALANLANPISKPQLTELETAARSDGGFMCSTPAPKATSRRLSRRWSNNASAPCWLPPIPSSTTGARSLSRWRRAIGCRRATCGASSSPMAG
jgi:putative tryptophan/tyrosine transport system substrate-binding protein